MTGEEMENVIDKIAEKAGVAVEKIQPIADQVINEVQMRGAVLSGICLFFIVFFSILAILLQRKIYNYEMKLREGGDKKAMPEMGMICYVFLFLVLAGLVPGFFIGLFEYIAPLASILGV